MSDTRYDRLQAELAATPRRWLVTGAAGFIGSHLVENLLRLRQHVVGLDNLVTGRRENLDEIRAAVGAEAWSGFRFIEGDICDLDCCRSACEGREFVLHQAALGSVPRSLADPVRSHRANVDGFVNMLVAARDAGVRRFVYASSSSVYGDHPALPKVEHQVGVPLSPYAATKVANELYAGVFSRCYQIPTVGLRYFNVFGPRQDPNGAYAAVIPVWFKALLGGDEIAVNGDGQTSRDFCYVTNVVQANLLAAVAVADDRAHVFNIAVGQRTTLLGLIGALQEVLRAQGVFVSPRVSHRAERVGDMRHSLADIGLARTLMGYEPSHTLEAGLAEACHWYRDRVQNGHF